MNWLEIVNIRTAGKTELIKALECCGNVQQDLEAGGTVCVCVYRNTIGIFAWIYKAFLYNVFNKNLDYTVTSVNNFE